MKTKSFKFIAAAIVMILGFVILPVNQVGAAARGCVAGTYRQGNSGTCVRYIQTILTYNLRSGSCGNVNTAVGIDGSFGPQTAAGVKAYQRENCLVADGIVGPNTWRALCSQAFYSRVGSPTDNSVAWSAGLSAGCSSLYANYCYSGRWCMYV